ncbi:MAG TPA: PP0621 family protein [Burkholderiales bacterium]|nr:PP0621 family protein [Burkholderiales bacterium]
MAKFLLLIALFIVLYLIFRSIRRAARAAPSETPGAKRAEDMVRCKICGVHLPRSESITSRGEFFCSQEHLRLADRGQSGR